MSARIDRARLNVALASGLTVFLCRWLGHVPGLAVGLAYLGPGMFVFLLLWLGRYPGEKAILRFIRPPRLRRARKSAAPSHRVRVRIPRGGALLAGALAGRAPPLRACLHWEAPSTAVRLSPASRPSRQADAGTPASHLLTNLGDQA
jgi:hypothetical protein